MGIMLKLMKSNLVLLYGGTLSTVFFMKHVSSIWLDLALVFSMLILAVGTFLEISFANFSKSKGFVPFASLAVTINAALGGYIVCSHVVASMPTVNKLIFLLFAGLIFANASYVFFGKLIWEDAFCSNLFRPQRD